MLSKESECPSSSYMGILKSVYCTFFLLLFSVGSAVAASSEVEVVAGEELILFPKKGVVARSFLGNASQSAFSSARVSKLKFLGSKVAVAGVNSLRGSQRKVDRLSLLQACEQLKNAELDCEINHVVRQFAVPNDSFYSSLSGLRKIRADAAWDVSTGSSAIKVAVIDTGVDYSHSDLAGNISLNTNEVPGNGIDDDANGFIDDYYGYDFANSDADPMDDQSHGTHVAGTIGAIGNNGSGVVGVNWSVGIIPVKVLGANGSGTIASVIAGVNYAVSRGANVINLSLGGPGYSQTFYDSIATANVAGVLVVAAAGNETNNNDSAPSYPASYNLSNVLSVAATTSTDGLASFSNFGALSVHLAAPGVSIASTLPGGVYGSYSGTSMACPHVAGAAALVKAANPALSMLQIRSILLASVDPVAGLSGKVSTAGRLNVATAVAAATGTTPAPTPVEPTPVPPSDGGGGGGGGAAPGEGEEQDPGDGDESPELPSDLSFVGAEYVIKSNKANILVYALDQDDFEMENINISLTCVKKLVGQKVTNANGDAKFTYKLKGSSANCVAVATDGVSVKKRSFKIKKATRKRK